MKKTLSFLFVCLWAAGLGTIFADTNLPVAPVNASDSADGMALPAQPLITFTAKSGEVISNAEVVHTNDGVSLVWEKDGGATGGTVRMEDLPPDLQTRFGYSYEKTKKADELAAARKAEWNKEVAAAALAEQQAAQAAALYAKTNKPAASTNQVAKVSSPPVKHSTPVRYHHVRRRIIIR